MKSIFLFLLFNSIAINVFANSDDSCRYKLYDKAICDTSSIFDYLIGFKFKSKSGKIKPAVTENRTLWAFFKSKGYSFEKYKNYVIDVTLKGSVIPIDFDLENNFHYYYAKPIKANQNKIKQGYQEAYDYMVKKSSEDSFVINSCADIIFTFWIKGVGIMTGENNGIYLSKLPNCKNVKRLSTP